MVDQATLVTDVFSEIFSLLNSNVTSKTDSTGTTVELRQSENGNYWYGSYPETKLITDKTAYPIGVIDTPNFLEEEMDWNFNNNEITVDVTVYGARAEHPPLFIQAVAETLRQNFDTLQKEGLKHLSFGQTRTDVTAGRGGDRGDLKIHEMTVPIELEFGVANINTVVN